jgi:hypothetical protein
MHTPRLTLSLLVTALGLALGATPALAAKPTAVTGDATNITPVGATLNGTVDPRGAATSAFFQYGTTKSYGNRTPNQDAGINPGTVPIAADVTKLKSATTYHFRVVAENKDGRVNGPDKTFKTSAPTTTPVFTPNPVRYGDPFTVTGQIVGSNAAGAEVSLFSRAFPFTDDFTQFGNTVVADSAGNYVFAGTSALITAQFEVRGNTKPAFTSEIETLNVASRLGIKAPSKVRKGHKVRFHGIVAPAQEGLLVEIQKLQRDGTFKRFASAPLTHRNDGRSNYSVHKRLYKRGVFRAYVFSAGGAYQAGSSGLKSIKVLKPKRRKHH